MLDNINEILISLTVILAASAIALRLILRVSKVEWITRLLRWTLEYVDVGLSALAIALVIRSFVVEPFKIPSSSMEDTLLIGDHLFVNRFLYGLRIPYLKSRPLALRQPRRGDILVFIPPHEPDKDFIKRVVGVPGDIVEIRAGRVFVNGTALVEPYIVHKDDGPWRRTERPRDVMPPLKVPPGQLFMMGDNRDRSLDSRWWGTASLLQVKGKAFLIYWSWDPDPAIPLWDVIHKIRWKRMFNLIS